MTDKPTPSLQRLGSMPEADAAVEAGAAADPAEAETAADAEAAAAETAAAGAAGVEADGGYPALGVDIDSEDFLTVLREVREEANRKSDQPIPAYREYPPGEVSTRAKAIYRDQILPSIEPPPKGVFVAIDIDSGDYEIHERDVTAMRRLIRRRPVAMTFLMRVGYPAAHRHTGIRPGKGRPILAQRA